MPSPVEVTTPSEREIVVTRTFNAPAQLVFDFHTKPEHLQKWLLGPPGWSMPICEVDLRVGGAYRYVWRSDDGSREFGVRGKFQEITAPVRIVNTETMDGAHGDALVTLALVQSGASTTLSTTIQFATQAERDQALESGMTDGMSASYDRLEEYMHATKEPVS